MAELPERDTALLLDMLLAARDAQTFVEGLDEAAFLASRLHQNAAIRSLEVLGEAAGRISAATRASHPEIPWREITGMRHRLIHGYGEVRLDLVWTVLRDRLAPLIAVVAGLVPDDSDAGL
jgi:uncharacterized protein with HEPN domain